MPLYDYKCNEHGEFANIWAGINETVPCPKCQVPMVRLISAPNIAPDWTPYWEHNITQDPILIQSRQHWRETLKKHNLVCRG